jgi:hypothetical protein
MHARQTCWINLEYLSAEDWVESCHGLPALRADGLASHFFFPGFTERTGGLLREADLFTRRDAWQADRLAQRDFLAQLGLCEAALDAWSCRSPESRGAESEGAESTGTESPATEAVCPQLRPYEPAPMLVSLFCYPDIPLQSLTDTLACAARPTILLVPAGIAPDLHSGQYGQLLVERIPFLPQAEYDKVLWTCDLNFVRGEDSILRALWSGKPLIWQIYPQTEHTHLLKLDAWLKRAALPGLVQTLMQAWNQSDQERFACTLRGSLEPDSFQQWQEQAARFCQEQSGLPDLASALNQFCVQ